MYEASVEELDTRSMSLQTLHSSQLLTFQTHVQEAVSRARAERSRRSGARARIGTRGGVRVAFGTASTTVMPSFNGVARRRSSVKVLSGHPAQLHTIGCHLVLRRGTRSCSRACASSIATRPVARALLFRLRLSRSHSNHPRRSSARGVPRVPILCEPI